MSTLKDLMREYWAHRPMELAAALSYYSLLSLAPLVLMTVALAALLFERGAVEATRVSDRRAARSRVGTPAPGPFPAPPRRGAASRCCS